MKKARIWIIAMMLVIGFASVVTTLNINGTFSVGYNDSEFNVYFKEAILDDVKLNYPDLSEDKKTITFSTDKLTLLDETSVLNYTVINDSVMYDAKVTINCTYDNSEYIKVTNKIEGNSINKGTDLVFDLAAQQEKNGTITSQMIKTYSGDDTSISVSCSLYVEPVEVKDEDKVIVPERDKVYLPSTTQTSTANYYKYRQTIKSINVDTNINTSRMNLAASDDVWDLSETQDGSLMAYAIEDTNDNLYDLYIESDDKDIYFPEDSSFFFSGFTKTHGINGIEKLHTDDVTNMVSMFNHFGDSPGTFYLDLRSFNTSKVTNMMWMFQYAGFASTDAYLNVSGWDTSNVTNMDSMFYQCFYTTRGKAELIIGHWDVKNVTRANLLFWGLARTASEINFEISNDWDFEQPAVLLNMFYGIGSYAYTEDLELDLSNWKLPNAANATNIFAQFGTYARSVKLNCKNWDIENVTDISGMFSLTGQYAEYVSINVDNWNTSNVTKMDYAFGNIGMYAKDVKIDLENWDFSNVTSTKSMFNAFGMGKTDSNIGSTVINMNNANFNNLTIATDMFNSVGTYKKKTTININNWKLNNTTTISEIFNSVGTRGDKFVINAKNWDAPELTTISTLVKGYNGLDRNSVIYLDGINAPKLVSISNLYKIQYGTAKDLEISLKGIDFTKLTTYEDFISQPAASNARLILHVDDQTQKDWIVANTVLTEDDVVID